MKLEDGSPDCMEFYNLAQDDILGTLAPRKNPQVVEDNRKTFQDFFYHAHGITCHPLAHLDKHLGLKRDTLASFSPQDKPSGTSLRLLKTRPQKIGNHRTNLVGHTDLGSMTMLFNIVGGLQILPAGSRKH
jgi:isopenicillin N synthase-like dioxygenase